MLEPEKTKEQLAKELEEMRRRVEQLQDACDKNEESKRIWAVVKTYTEVYLKILLKVFLKLL